MWEHAMSSEKVHRLIYLECNSKAIWWSSHEKVNCRQRTDDLGHKPIACSMRKLEFWAGEWHDQQYVLETTGGWIGITRKQVEILVSVSTVTPTYERAMAQSQGERKVVGGYETKVQVNLIPVTQKRLHSWADIGFPT